MDEPKTILLNDLSLYRQRSGVGCYVAQLLKHMSAAGAGIRVIPLSQTLTGAPLRLVSSVYESTRRLVDNSEPQSHDRTANWRSLVASGVKAARRFGYSALNGYLSATSRLAGWSVYHEPDGIPLAIPAPTVTTVHDLSVLLFPHWHPKHRVLKYERNLRAGLEKTSFFLADSETTKRDMVGSLGIAQERIRVVPLAPRPEFRMIPSDQVRVVAGRLDLPARYLLFVGTIEPRKNVAGLLRAYALLPATLRREVPLVLAGGWGWNSDHVRQMLDTSPWKESVRWLGYLSDSDLVAVTNAAEALVYPSFYEGFGLPPLEAMACGRPVITTHAGSLAEVIGDSAMIVDPSDEVGLADAMRQLLVDRDLQDEYRRRGQERLKLFDWQETVRQTAQVYRAVA